MRALAKRYQLHIVTITALITIACLGLRYGHGIRLGTSWWGLLLMLSWGLTALSVFVQVIASNRWAGWLSLLVLSPHVFFLGYEFDAKAKSVLFVLFWGSVLWTFVVEVMMLFATQSNSAQTNQIPEEENLS